MALPQPDTDKGASSLLKTRFWRTTPEICEMYERLWRECMPQTVNPVHQVKTNYDFIEEGAYKDALSHYDAHLLQRQYQPSHHQHSRRFAKVETVFHEIP